MTFVYLKDMNKKILIGVVAVVAVAAAIAGYRIFFKQRSNLLVVSGNIEATTVDLSFKIPGRMVRRLVDEGDLVRKGEVVALLDNADLRESVSQQEANVRAAEWALTELVHGSRPEDIAQARANERRTRFALKELLNGSRPEDIAQAAAAADQARTAMKRAASEYAREKKLYLQGYISSLVYVNEKAAFLSAAQGYRQAEEHYKEVLRGPRIEDVRQAAEAWKQASAGLQEVLNGPRVEEIQQARARLNEAQALLAQAQTNLGYATLRSPITGVVLSKDSEDGEYLSAGSPVVTAADLKNVWLRAYLDETDLARVKFNETARVTTDTYPGKVYRGRVAFISSAAEFTPKTVQTREERTKLVYRIKIDLVNPNMELKPGMPADAEL